MSGIIAIFKSDGRQVDPALLRPMSEAIAHRGPDGEGLWTNGSIALAHRLLYTTPESLSERQPLEESQNQYRLVFDGRVDNRDELIACLGDAFTHGCGPDRNPTDPDLVIEAYRRWGTGCPERIMGEFAFALWDEKNRRLFCARDRMGMKPFHYRWDGSTLWVSSEIKPLLGVTGRQPEPDDEMILAFLLREFREGDEEKTFFRGICRIPPGHFLIAEKGRLRRECYWAIDPGRETRYARDEEYLERFLALFKEAVRCCTRSAFPVGAFLSGGLDSSSIVCTATRFSSVPMEVFTTYGDRPASDERQYARLVSEAARVKAHEFRLTGWNPVEGLGPLLRQVECPVAGIIDAGPGGKLRSLMQSTGCRAILSGVGGDQILDEYGHPADTLASIRPWRFIRELRDFATDYGGYPWEFALMCLSSIAPQPLKYWGKRILRGIPPFWMNGRLAREVGLRERIRQPRHSLRFPSYSQSDSYSLTFSPYRVLTLEADERAMAQYGLEIRYPYFDSRLAEFVLSIPPDKRTEGGKRKYLLRHAMKGILPETIRLRQGKGDSTDEMDQALIALCRQNPPEPLADRSGRMGRYLDLKGAQEFVERFLKGERDCRHTLWFIITVDHWLAEFWK